MSIGSAMGFGLGSALFWSPGFILLMLWSLVWKGLALWHAAQRKEVWWFLAVLVLNTVGILEIVYLFGILKKKPAELFAFTGLVGKTPSSQEKQAEQTDKQ
jgi:methionyl-tRNA synthetase